MFDLKSYLIGKHGGTYTASLHLPSYLMGRKKSVPIKTLTGKPPLIFNSDGSNLVDYTIYGASGGVGDEVLVNLPEPLRGIDEYADVLDLSTGTLTKRIESFTFDDYSANEAFYDGRYYVNRGAITELDYKRSNVEPCCLCSHLSTVKQSNGVYGVASDAGYAQYALGSQNSGAYYANSFHYSMQLRSLNDWSQFRQDQTTLGTPITVWYVSETPSTQSVQVPPGLTGSIEGYLIQAATPTPDNPVYPTANGVKQQDGTYNIHAGKYAIPLTINGQTYTIYLDAPLGEGESISLADTGIDIPTVKGENTLSVDTTVQPERVTIVYKGG